MGRSPGGELGNTRSSVCMMTIPDIYGNVSIALIYLQSWLLLQFAYMRRHVISGIPQTLHVAS